MLIKIAFYSYFKELTGCREATEQLPEGSTVSDLLRKLGQQFPSLAALEKSTLAAVGVEYCPRSYVLRDGDEVSLFPPVQGG